MEHTIKLTNDEVILLHLAIITHICHYNDCSDCALKYKPNELCIANKMINQSVKEFEDKINE